MMDLIRRILGIESATPLYSKLSKAISRSGLKFDIQFAYYLGGFKYSDEEYQSLAQASKNGNFDNRFLEKNYDVQADNIELYYIKDAKGISHLVILLDPFELFQPEEILNVYSVNEEEVNLNEKTLIFSR